jgi:hypothetical protein
MKTTKTTSDRVTIPAPEHKPERKPAPNGYIATREQWTAPRALLTEGLPTAMLPPPNALDSDEIGA